MNYRRLARQSIGFFPTPLIEAARLSSFLGGPRILMKRDDHTGLALGGNKTRKLEFLLAEALANGCDCVITAGAIQSNHCRQTAAAAAALGLPCHLVLGGSCPDAPNGNLLLDLLFGATIHWAGESRKGEQMPRIAEQLRQQGHHPYVIPYGGSNAVGAAAFVDAMAEVNDQLAVLGTSVSHVIFPSSSGGMQAGLIVGKQVTNSAVQLIGIAIDKDEAGDAPFERHVARLATHTARTLGVELVCSESDVLVRHEHAGAGYGIAGEREREAITLTARKEGVLLDPVYTGRAMGGLLHMIRTRELTAHDTVLFWHTGGSPALFHYASELT